MGRHTEAEIAAKLEKADELTGQGKLNRDIAKALGVSVMTYHRWRKTRETSQLAGPFQPGGAKTDGSEQTGRVRELQHENSQLRRLVTDLLLEKMNLEEVMQGHRTEVRGSIRQ